MRVPKYKSYKDSGVEWLGDVPSHWEIRRARRLFEIKKRIVGTLGFDVLSITQQGLKVKDIESNDGQLSMDYSKYQLVEPGDFAMNHMDLLTGYVDISRTRGVTSPDYRVFSIRHPNQCFDRYYLYLLQNCYRFKIFYAFGQGASQLGRWRLPTDQFKEFLFPQPPVQEQLQIGAFLDHETAKIDMLAEEQQRLIGLLGEKRQAIISHAVTKGLDPKAPTKHSGVEWLGEVPKHWKVASTKRLCSKITDGAHISPETENGTYCFVSTKDVTEQGIDFDGCLRTSAASYEYLVRTGCRPLVGDVLFSKDGTIGRTIVVTDKREFVVASSLIIIRPDSDQLDSGFLNYLYQSAFVRSQVESYVKGAGLPRLSIQNLLRVIGVFPPLHEQVEIAAYLDDLAGKFDNLISEAGAAISVLQERRNAVISAVVTGKIDTRGLVSAKAEAA